MSGLKPLFSLRRKEASPTPISIPKILHAILECMDMTELLTLRHVNKQWNEKCTAFLQQKTLVVLRTWNSVDSFVNMYSSSKYRTKPFTTLKLDSSLQLNDGNLQETLGKLGLNFTSLIIACHCNADEWMALLYKLFPNLESLKITGSIPYEILLNKMKPLNSLTSINFHITNKRSEQLFIRRFSSDLFAVTPNLSSVTWGTAEVFTDLLPRAMFHCLVESAEVTNITEFCCSSLVFGIRDLKELASKRFPLRRLEISIGVDVPSEILGDFLEFHGDSLEYLRLVFGPANSFTVRISENGKMKCLQTLILEDYKRTLGFVLHLKTLKKLVLVNSNVERAFAVDWDDDQVKLLPDLDIFEVFSEPWRKVQKFPMSAVIRLALYFPKLRVLKLQNLDDKCLRRMFRNFPYLVQLQAQGTFTDDSFKVLSPSVKSVSDGCSRTVGMQYSYSPAHLISLRRLEIDSVCMTDEFILEGIIKWKGLRHIGLKNCRIENSTLTRILMEMDLHYLKLECCEIISQHDAYDDDQTVDLAYVQDCIQMNYGDIKKWRIAIIQLLVD